MASYRAIATGNFSNVSIWNIWNGSAWVAASVIPSNADDVWSNSFTVTIDQNVNVSTLRNRNLGAPSGIVSDGGFQIITGGLNIVCSTIINQSMVGTVDLLTIDTTSNSTSLQLSSIYTANGLTGRVLTIAGISVVNIVGDFSCGANSNTGCRMTGAGTVNLIGNINTINYTPLVTVWSTSLNSTFNLTGNITPSLSGFTQTQCYGIRPLGDCTITINGNIDWTGGASQTSNIIGTIMLLNINATNSTVIINGNIIGGTIFNSHIAVGNGGGSTIIEHNGILYGGLAGSAGPGSPGISNLGSSSVTIVSGPFVFNAYGCPPFICTRLFLSNNISTYIDFASNSTNGAAFPGIPPTRSIMYSPNTLADSPVPANVRQGITYALGSQVGTLAVPSPSDVRKNTPTDNTIGTADLTAQDFLDLLSTSPDPIAERLRNVATVQTTGDQITSLN